MLLSRHYLRVADRAPSCAAAPGELCKILSQNRLHHCTERMSDLIAQVRAAEHIQNRIEDAVEEANRRCNWEGLSYKILNRLRVWSHHFHDDEYVVGCPAEYKAHHHRHYKPNKTERATVTSVCYYGVYNSIAHYDDDQRD